MAIQTKLKNGQYDVYVSNILAIYMKLKIIQFV